MSSYEFCLGSLDYGDTFSDFGKMPVIELLGCKVVIKRTSTCSTDRVFHNGNLKCDNMLV
jgi:hypothetical protein